MINDQTAYILYIILYVYFSNKLIWNWLITLSYYKIYKLAVLMNMPLQQNERCVGQTEAKLTFTIKYLIQLRHTCHTKHLLFINQKSTYQRHGNYITWSVMPTKLHVIPQIHKQ